MGDESKQYRLQSECYVEFWILEVITVSHISIKDHQLQIFAQVTIFNTNKYTKLLDFLPKMNNSKTDLFDPDIAP